MQCNSDANGETPVHYPRGYYLVSALGGREPKVFRCRLRRDDSFILDRFRSSKGSEGGSTGPSTALAVPLAFVSTVRDLLLRHYTFTERDHGRPIPFAAEHGPYYAR